MSGHESGAPLERQVAREAAAWLVRLGSAQASAADVGACDRWRASHAEHERAWQRAQSLHRAFGVLPPAVGLATLARPRSTGRRAALKAAVCLALVPGATWGVWRAGGGQAWLAEWRTGAGERRDIALADGSRLHLNTATAVDADITTATRELHLIQGEIHVQAVAALQGALRVRTPMGDVVARQAAFTVRLQANRCEVDCVRGTLTVLPAQGATRELAPTQQVWFDRHAAHLSLDAQAQTPDWLRGMLHARDMRLDDFAAELARYRSGIVRVDPAVAALRVSGAFPLDRIQGVLDALPTLLPVQVRSVTPWWTRIGPLAI